MTAPVRNYSDPTGVETPRAVDAAPTQAMSLTVWPPVANPVGHARPVGESLVPSPIQAPSVVTAPWLNFTWTLASNAFFRIWGSVTRRGWQIYPNGRNR